MDDGPEERALGLEADRTLAFPSQPLLAFCFLISKSRHSNTGGRAKMGFSLYIDSKSSVVAAWSTELRRILRFSPGSQEAQRSISDVGYGRHESERHGVGRLSEMIHEGASGYMSTRGCVAVPGRKAMAGWVSGSPEFRGRALLP